MGEVVATHGLVSSRNGTHRAAQAVHRFVKSHRILWIPAGWVSRLVASAPETSPIRSVLGPLRDGLRGAMATEDVLTVLGALESTGVPFYLAGGWGVDALVGRQSRSHDDLDVVIDHYDEDLPRAVDVLKSMGFELVASYERRAWMPKNTVLEDGAGRRVDLDSLNWKILAREFGPPGSRRVRSCVIRRSRLRRRHRGREAGPLPLRRCPTPLPLPLRSQRPAPARRHLVARRAGGVSSPLADDLGMSAAPESTLVILVPSAEATVGKLRRKLDRSAAWSIPLHITILYPFAAPDAMSEDFLLRLGAVLRGSAPFEFALTEIGWFDQRVMYLAPTPREPFAELTNRIVADFPEHRPYGGAYATSSPI